MHESENNHTVSRGNVSPFSIVMRAVFTALFLFLGLVLHGQNSIDRFFLKVEQHSHACTLHYIAEDKMYDSNPNHLTVRYKWHLSNKANAEKRVILTSIGSALKAIDSDQTNESMAYENGNEDIRFSVSMDLIRIEAPYPISSVTIKSVGGKMIYLESEVGGFAFTLDLSGFDAGFYSLEIIEQASVGKPKH